MFYAPPPPYFLLPDTLISPLVGLWQYNGRVLELTLRRIVRFRMTKSNYGQHC